MDLSYLKRLWQVLRSDPTSSTDLRKFRPIAWRSALWMLASEAAVLAQVYPLKLLIDGLAAPANQHFWFGLSRMPYLASVIGASGVLFYLGSRIDLRLDVARNSATWLFYSIVNDFGHRKQLSLSADWHTTNSTGEKESVLSKNHRKIDRLIDELVFVILPVTIRVTFISITIWFISWPFGAIGTGMLAAFAYSVWRSEQKVKPLRQDFRAHTKQIDREDTELTSEAMLIKEQGLEDQMTSEHHDTLQEHWEKETVRHEDFRKILLKQNHVVTIWRILFYAAAVAGYKSGASIGSIVLASAWMERVYSNLDYYVYFQYTLNEGAEALHELVELFEAQPTIKQPARPKWPTEPKGRIEVKDLSFTYPQAKKPALSGINLTIEPGMTVALVGESGGGKSTLAKLIIHQYDPDKGQILVDGVDLREIDDKRYRSQLLGTVPQESRLFDRTIRHNIAIGQGKVRNDEVLAAATKADAHRFIASLPDKYETMVGEDGVKLSGGQKQRLAIARALLRHPHILVLDEPTSNLDAETEFHIKQTMEKLTASRQATILVIAHRFSTIEMADLIVVLEKGKITELGTHEQLLRHNGLYTRLRRHQGLLE